MRDFTIQTLPNNLLNCPPGYFIQMGAGAGDLDAGSGGRDGFSEYVKSLPKSQIEKIILVEPNLVNIPELTTSWKEYERVEIHQIGIVPSDCESELTFYYAEADGPNFQTCSTDRKHVLHHYPKGNILTFTAACVPVNSFLAEKLEDDHPTFLAIDIEGLDFEIMMALDLHRFTSLRSISWEYIHLTTPQLVRVAIRLLRHGFIYAGDGVDVRGLDLLFERGALTPWQFLRRFLSFSRVVLGRLRF